MRITFVTPPPNLSGGNRVVGIHAAGLAARGHDVTIVAGRPEALGWRGRARALLGAGRRIPLEGTSFAGLEAMMRFARKPGPVAAADIPPGDVVIATWWRTAPVVAALPADRGAKAYFMQDYGADSHQPLEALIPTWRLPLAMITISDWLAGLVRAHVPGARPAVVPNAVDAERFRAPPRGRRDRPAAGLMYRPMPSKGMETALEAIARVRLARPDLRVIAYGRQRPGPDPRLDGALDFHARPADAALPGLYGACDAWLFPSRLEGFGLPVLEAMACRTPVVGTRAGCAPEVIADGVNGFLVEVDDAGAMAERLAALLAMPEADWRAMSGAARATATRYSWAEATRRFEAALEAAAG